MKGAFEKWAIGFGLSVDSVGGKGYTSKRTNWCWRAWQARGAAATPFNVVNDHPNAEVTIVAPGIERMADAGGMIVSKPVDGFVIRVTEKTRSG